MSTLAKQSAHVEENSISNGILRFMQHARDRRFRIGVQESLDCQALAAGIGITQKHTLKHCFKSLICQNKVDWQGFDEMFDNYWHSNKKQQDSVNSIGGHAPRSQHLAQENSVQPKSNSEKDLDFTEPKPLLNQEQLDADTSPGSGTPNKTAYACASAQDSLSRQNFKQISNASELQRMEDLCEQLAKRIRKRLLRRQRIHHHGQQIHIRQTLRQNLAYGGEPLSLAWRQRRQQTPKLVLLLDVSRSMNVYSYLFLRFARGILSAFKQADAFAFHTRLQPIGDTLREPCRHKLADKMALVSAGFAGGTRIDESLRSFNQDYGRLLKSNSTVVILSDGYDTGEPDSLVKQLKRIKQRSRRIVWLNPLLGQQSYEAKTRSMQAVLPLLDVFAPAHNLDSLAALEHYLGR